MHMHSKWGFKIALKLNQKIFRFNFENGKSGCCLYDYSYLRIFSTDENTLQTFIDRYCKLDEPFSDEKNEITGFICKDFCTPDGFVSPVTILKYQESWLIIIHPSSIDEFVKIADEFSIKGPLKLNIFCLFGNLTNKTIGIVQSKYSDQMSVHQLPSPFHLTSQYCWIIVEQGKGREHWRRFIYANAKPYSLTNMYNFYFENEALLFPFHFHLFKGFSQEMNEIAQQRETEWKAKPPAKRVNYAKFGIESPFQFLQFTDSPSQMEIVCAIV